MNNSIFFLQTAHPFEFLLFSQTTWNNREMITVVEAFLAYKLSSNTILFLSQLLVFGGKRSVDHKRGCLCR